MGLLEWIQNMWIFVFHVHIYQALTSNQVNKMVHFVDVHHNFPPGTPGFARWAYEQRGHDGHVEGLA